MMAKIEALQAVGAGELADQALAKVMQFEIDRLQHEQRRLQAELAHFEQSYQMTSEECQRKFDAGELGDAVEFFDARYKARKSHQPSRAIGSVDKVNAVVNPTTQ
jgi:hypothetical protein